MNDKSGYFEDAMSDFIHEMASAGAIRHLVDAGYSLEQIISKLDYPTSRTRVEQTVNQYMKESGILLSTLPVEAETMAQCRLNQPSIKELGIVLQEKIQKNGIEHSYMSCPFGIYAKSGQGILRQKLSCLTNREQEYILGIPWEQDEMYHRLNDRMLEIGKYLAVNSDIKLQFYFLQTKELIMLL